MADSRRDFDPSSPGWDFLENPCPTFKASAAAVAAGAAAKRDPVEIMGLACLRGDNRLPVSVA